MAYEARLVDVAAQPIAAVRRGTTRDMLGKKIVGGFNVLWPICAPERQEPGAMS